MAAWKYLSDRGYKILEKNYRAPIGEIDIVAEKSGRLIFVEVKTRSDKRLGLPQEAVGSAKQKKLIQLAAQYMKMAKREDARVSFEVLAVLWSEKGAHEFNLIENAFDVAGEF